MQIITSSPYCGISDIMRPNGYLWEAREGVVRTDG